MKKQNSNNLTELVFILDRSGSMAGLESDTIGGFNGVITKQKKEAGEAYVTTYIFDNVTELLHDRVKLSEIQPMTDKEYTVRGCTALLDAVGAAIVHIKEIHRYARAEDVPAQTIFVITTDGMENASHNYNAVQIKKMIEQQKKIGWEFLFLGANIDAVEVASGIGISESCTANYRADGAGTEMMFQSVCAPISAVRNSCKIDSSWKKKLEDDCRKRGK